MEVLKRDKWLRRSLAVLALAVVGWYVVSQTTFIEAWSLNGSPASLTQVQAWCGSYIGQVYIQSSVGESASACSQVKGIEGVVGAIEALGLIALLVAGYRVYRYNFPKGGRGQQPQQYWPR